MAQDVGFPIDGFPKGLPWRTSARLIATGDVIPVVAATGTDTTPVVTETYIAELAVRAQGVKATGVSLLNGTLVAGNVKVYLYNAAGKVIASSASVAQAGAAAYQRIPFSSPIKLVPGTYYIGLQMNNTGGRFRSHLFGDFGSSKKTGEVFGTGTTITPPTTFTASLGPIASLY